MLSCSVLSSSWHYSSSPWFLVKVCGLRVNLICFSSIPDFPLSCLPLAVIPLKKESPDGHFLLYFCVIRFSSFLHLDTFSHFCVVHSSCVAELFHLPPLLAPTVLICFFTHFMPPSPPSILSIHTHIHVYTLFSFVSISQSWGLET